MDADEAIALISASGIELTDRRRNASNDGWSLSFANGSVVDVKDSGVLSASGNGTAEVARLLDLPGQA